MKAGDIIIADVLTSEQTFKKRPVLILKILPKFNDLLVCGISSQLNNAIDGLDIIINSNSKDFRLSGLIKDSVIRISYLSVIPANFSEGKIGIIPGNMLNLIIDRFCQFLKK